MRKVEIVTALLVLAPLSLACRADPPGGDGDFGGPPVRPQDPLFADVAVCTAPESCLDCAADRCPGPGCSQNVVQPDEPEGQAVDLARCTLDLVFTRGTLITDGGGTDPRYPDVAIHLGQQLASIARIEASADGVSYQIAGFVNGLPAGANPACGAICASGPCQAGASCPDGRACYARAGTVRGWCRTDVCQPGGVALLDLAVDVGVGAGGCNTIANVSSLRISRYELATGAFSVDAVQALEGSFALAR